MAKQLMSTFLETRAWHFPLLAVFVGVAFLATASCSPKPAAVLSPRPTGLEGLFAANALHRSLVEVARPLGVVVSYKGSLSWGEQGGLRSVGVPDEWCVATRRAVDAAGRDLDLSRLILTVKLHGPGERPDNATLFTYAGRRYALTIRVPDGEPRWEEARELLGMSPLEFVQQAAKRVSEE